MLSQEIDYPEDMLPDEGEALRDPDSSTQREIGAAARSGAEMWENRPEPKKPLPGVPERGSMFNTILAI